jgi:hypothetical protein
MGIICILVYNVHHGFSPKKNIGLRLGASVISSVSSRPRSRSNVCTRSGMTLRSEIMKPNILVGSPGGRGGEDEGTHLMISGENAV